MHIEEQIRVIKAKDLRISEDTEIKKDTILPCYDGEPTFQGFLLNDDGDEEKASNKKASANETPPKPNATEDTIRLKPAEQERKSRSGRAVGPTEMAKKAQSLETRKLIAHLTKLLDYN